MQVQKATCARFVDCGQLSVACSLGLDKGNGCGAIRRRRRGAGSTATAMVRRRFPTPPAPTSEGCDVANAAAQAKLAGGRRGAGLGGRLPRHRSWRVDACKWYFGRAATGCRHVRRSHGMARRGFRHGRVAAVQRVSDGAGHNRCRAVHCKRPLVGSVRHSCRAALGAEFREPKPAWRGGCVRCQRTGGKPLPAHRPRQSLVTCCLPDR